MQCIAPTCTYCKGCPPCFGRMKDHDRWEVLLLLNILCRRTIICGWKCLKCSRKMFQSVNWNLFLVNDCYGLHVWSFGTACCLWGHVFLLLVSDPSKGKYKFGNLYDCMFVVWITWWCRTIFSILPSSWETAKNLAAGARYFEPAKRVWFRECHLPDLCVSSMEWVLLETFHTPRLGNVVSALLPAIRTKFGIEKTFTNQASSFRTARNPRQDLGEPGIPQ